MSPAIVVLVLLSALLHAGWNTLLKISGDRLLALAFIAGASALVFVPMLPFAAAPPPESWPFLAGSVVLHGLYFFCLLKMYRHGELSHAYPIARGTGPVLVAIAGVIGFGGGLTPLDIVGLLVTCGGIAAIAVGGGKLRYALATGITIGLYTLNDGLGVRAAHEHWWSFVAWMHVLDVSVLLAVVVFLRKPRQWLAFAKRSGGKTLVAGFMAAGCYTMVLWAMTVAPLTHVAALRETSVVIAAVLGNRVLGEPFGGRRLAAAVCVVAGIALLAG